MKNPDRNQGFSDTRCTMAIGRVCLNHQSICGAMTNQLYTISIKSRKPIGKTYALVSPKRCKSVNQFFVVALQRSKIKRDKEWIKDRPLSSTTDITSNGDGWNERVQASPRCLESGETMNPINREIRWTV